MKLARAVARFFSAPLDWAFPPGSILIERLTTDKPLTDDGWVWRDVADAVHDEPAAITITPTQATFTLAMPPKPFWPDPVDAHYLTAAACLWPDDDALPMEAPTC